jgi:outer membrane protein TolC
VRRAAEELAEKAALFRRLRDSEPVVDDGLARLQRALDAEETDLLQLATVQTRVLAARRARLRLALDCRLTRVELDRLAGPAPPPPPDAPDRIGDPP